MSRQTGCSSAPQKPAGRMGRNDTSTAPHWLAPAIRLPADSPYVEAAKRALEAVFERPPLMTGMGGSIPAVAAIKRLLGMDSLLVGFGLKDDLVHSPNEKFELRCFEAGMRSHARLLAELAQLG